MYRLAAALPFTSRAGRFVERRLAPTLARFFFPAVAFRFRRRFGRLLDPPKANIASRPASVICPKAVGCGIFNLH